MIIHFSIFISFIIFGLRSYYQGRLLVLAWSGLLQFVCDHYALLNTAERQTKCIVSVLTSGGKEPDRLVVRRLTKLTFARRYFINARRGQ